MMSPTRIVQNPPLFQQMTMSGCHHRPSPRDRRQLELECHCAILLSRFSLLLFNSAFTKLPTRTKLSEEAVTGLGPLPPHTGSEDRPRRKRRSRMTRSRKRRRRRKSRRRRRRRRTETEVGGGREEKALAVHNHHFQPKLHRRLLLLKNEDNYSLMIR